LAGNAHEYLLQFRIGKARVFTKPRSLQESGMSFEEILLNIQKALVQYPLVNKILIALHPDQAGLEFLQRFAAAGFEVADIIILGESDLSLPEDFPPPFCIPNAPTMPANEIAALLRQRWEWL
jgi:hypothetical protein